MSKFYVQQHLLASNSRTIIKNEKGESIYLLVGRWGTKGDALSLYEMSGHLIASIKQTSFAMGTRFDLYYDFKKVGTLQRILSFNRDFYYIHQLGWVVIGDIKNHHYTINQLNKTIMTMEKEYLLTGDFYVLAVENDEHAPLCICIAAVLDYWLIHRKKEKQSTSSRLFSPKLDW